ncbi:MAG: YggS family pyridoxal phosphate-dependent enzyme [Ruminococcaceae bacterium]|nr:YggS family pyridoxal phosphate-dependent enzyme [Oscillospiraceae bacterium]
MMTYIQKNLAEVRAQLAQAASACGRETPCHMLAAVKYAVPGELAALLDAGVTDVGENRVQQLLENAPLYAARDVRVHFIGTLQTNKVKYIADKVDMIHSLASERLAAEIEKRAAACGRVIDVLVELNMAREEAKTGLLPEEAEALCRTVLSLPHLRLRGFMTMGPVFECEEDYRRYFAGTVAFGNALWQTLSLAGRPLYSMGMSQSFAAAVKEGADFVRVGRRLFVGRPE